MGLEADWKPNGLVSWTTDFGLENAFVGTMRGVFRGAFSGGEWVDLTHGIPAQDVNGAALELLHAYPYFPAGTLHVAVVDPGVGTDRRILVAQRGGHCFLAPDNGLLGGVIEDQDPVWAPDTGPWELPNKGATFHGRDVFAPMAAALASGRLILRSEERCQDWDRGQRVAPLRLDSGDFELRVLLVDRFGNLVTNWDVSRFGAPKNGAELRIGSRSIPIVETYADVSSGGALALIDSLGHLEVAIRDGHAADQFALTVGDALQLRIKP